MITIHEFTEGALTRGVPLVMACGFFDGVHIGHQALLAKANAVSCDCRGRAVAMTFRPHPKAFLDPENSPLIITPDKLKVRLFEQFGLDGCILLRFNDHIRTLEPEAFLPFLRHEFPSLRHIVVGEDWRFGHRHRGDVALLKKLAIDHNIEVDAVAPVLLDGEKVSSTRVREALLSGNLEMAERLLGQRFAISDNVVSGRQIGTRLGFPTANLQPGGIMPLPGGSYCAYAVINEKEYRAVAYLGTRPTYGDAPVWFVEVFVMNENLDLYGQELEVQFVQHIRKEEKFSCEEDLAKAIAEDVAKANSLF